MTGKLLPIINAFDATYKIDDRSLDLLCCGVSGVLKIVAHFFYLRQEGVLMVLIQV
jgi:hypothetical protein